MLMNAASLDLVQNTLPVQTPLALLYAPAMKDSWGMAVNVLVRIDVCLRFSKGFVFVHLFLLTLLNLSFLTTLQMSMNARCVDRVQKIPFAITLLAPLNALAMMVLWSLMVFASVRSKHLHSLNMGRVIVYNSKYVHLLNHYVLQILMNARVPPYVQQTPLVWTPSDHLIVFVMMALYRMKVYALVRIIIIFLSLSKMILQYVYTCQQQLWMQM